MMWSIIHSAVAANAGWELADLNAVELVDLDDRLDGEHQTVWL